jgi:hypothetical protein
MGTGEKVTSTSYNEYAYTKVDLHNEVCEYLDKKLNFPERIYIQEEELNAVVKTLIEKFFLVDMEKNPFREQSMSTNTHGEPQIPAISPTTSYQQITPGQSEDRFENIYSVIQDYLAAVKVDDELERVTKARNEINELAFTLFKAADPGNLQCRTWDHVPRHSQNTYRNHPEKALEALNKK